jgi:hypothetical protein
MVERLDIEALRAEVLQRHNIALHPDDPIFVTVVLNERVLSWYVDQMHQLLEAERDAASAGTVQQLEVAQETAEKLVTQAGAFIHTQTQEVFEEASKHLFGRIEIYSNALDVKLNVAARLQRNIIAAAGISVATLCLILGLMLGHVSI